MSYMMINMSLPRDSALSKWYSSKQGTKQRGSNFRHSVKCKVIKRYYYVPPKPTETPRTTTKQWRKDQSPSSKKTSLKLSRRANMLPTSLPPPRSMRNSILMHGTCSDAVDAITQCGYLNTFDTHGNIRCFVWTGFRDVKGVFYHLEGSARGRHLENRLAVDPGFNSAEINKVRLYFIPDGGSVWEEGKGVTRGRRRGGRRSGQRRPMALIQTRK